MIRNPPPHRPKRLLLGMALGAAGALSLAFALGPRTAQAEDPDFCAQARWESQQCVAQYQACGGFFTPGCWEEYDACWTASGIDQCE